MRLFTLAAIAMLTAGCVDAVSSDQEILFLTTVDGKALPVLLSTGNDFYVFATVGHLAVPKSHEDCDYIIRYERINQRADVTGKRSSCRIDSSGGVTFDLDLGGNPKPVGSHAYRFERK
jgi:hypothetical protein